MTTTAPRFTIGTATGDAGYTGVLRRGRRVLFDCGHSHRNRDISTGVNGASARDCVIDLVRTVRSDRMATWYRDRMRGNAEQAIARYCATARQAQEWRDRLADSLAAFEAQRAELANILGNAPVLGQGTTVVLAPPMPEATCTRCGQPIRPTRWIPNPAHGSNWRDWRTVPATPMSPRPPCVGGFSDHPDPMGTELHHV